MRCQLLHQSSYLPSSLQLFNATYEILGSEVCIHTSGTLSYQMKVAAYMSGGALMVVYNNFHYFLFTEYNIYLFSKSSNYA